MGDSMNVEWLIALVVVVMLIALVSTFTVGFSRSNREENSDYMKRTGRNWTNLALLYAVIFLIVLLIFFIVWKS